MGCEFIACAVPFRLSTVSFLDVHAASDLPATISMWPVLAVLASDQT